MKRSPALSRPWPWYASTVRSSVALLAIVLPALAASGAWSADRYGLSPHHPLEIRSATDEPAVAFVLPSHSLYFRVLEEAADADGWLRIASLPSVEPPYKGCVPRAAVEVFDTAREARLRYFATHPLRAQADRVATALQSGYWDLREQGGEADSPSLWRRYGFDFTEWYVVRGKTYEAEIRDIADILAADERTLVVTLFIAATTTPPERLEIELLREDQVRISLAGSPAWRFGRARR